MAFTTLKKKIEERLLNVDSNYSMFIETEGQSISINPDKKMRAASVIKLPILIEGYRQIDNGEINAKVGIVWSEKDLVGGSGVLADLTSVHELSLPDILMLMTIVSDNTASNLAIKHLSIEKINRLSEVLGCTNTILGRQFMDFEAAEKGLDNYTSARDMVLFLKEAETGKILSEESKQQVKHALSQQQFVANLHGRFDENSEVIIASKSGSLEGVVNDVGIFEYRGMKVYAAVLLDNLPDNHTGQEIIADIGWYVYEYLHETDKTR
ncbi:serine hydrolase [Planomicrobium sp. CPCC 101079]|uniref:serine hydrolase n=1 Tax=Planomicrobium sp. CPCC 101079 TaxID=2599618 RepID=UPI0011B73CB0|nr:serine hydrolase [Planomicrobium sp. CPCC 101079]TWT04935.1 serine hydrolase [Planomicrobium sp. CPCC 101079]